MKIVFLIMNCKKYSYKAEKQKSGWLKRLPDNITYYHVIGDMNLKENFTIDEEKKIITIKCEDDYNHLPKKVILSFEVALNRLNFDYIFKTDDDQHLENNKFFEYLNNNKFFEYNYGGYVINVGNHYSEYYKIHNCLPKNLFLENNKYCNGRFYFLSKVSIKNLLDKKEEISKRYIEDHSIGYFLDTNIKNKTLKLKNTNLWFKEN